MSSKTSSLVVHAVHGTFDRKAGWVEAESNFFRKLASHLGPIHVVPFRWSGRNSHAKRMQAGELLAARILEQAERHPSSRHVILAHSHGGNIALYAMNDADVRRRTALIVTMGTPFIHAYERPRFTLDVYMRLGTIAGIAVLGTGIVAVALLASTLDLSRWMSQGLLIGCVVWFGLLALGALLNFVDWMNQQRECVLSRVGKRATEIIANAYDLPVLCFVVGRDEARAWLRLWTLLANSAERIWWSCTVPCVVACAYITSGNVRLVFGNWVAGPIGYALIEGTTINVVGWIIGSALFSAMFLAVLQVVCAVLIAVSRSTEFTYGEQMTISALYKVRAHLVPQIGTKRVQRIQVSSPRRWLAHSMYEDLHLPDQIAFFWRQLLPRARAGDALAGQMNADSKEDRIPVK